MKNFLKYMLNCLIQIFDFVANNVDKTPLQHTMATDGLLGLFFFTISFLVVLLKVCPNNWGQIKSITISIIIATFVMVLYFLIRYFTIQ